MSLKIKVDHEVKGRGHMPNNDDSLTSSDLNSASYRNASMRRAQESFIASHQSNASESNNTNNTDNNINSDSDDALHRTQHQNISDNQNDDNNNNNDSNNNINQNRYIPYNQRSNYDPSLFTGAKEEKWSYPNNTNGWSAYDNTDPYNPYHKKKSKWKIWTSVAGVCVLLLGVWGIASEHASNEQSTQPQKPRVVKKTVIEREPQSNNSQNQNQQPSSSNGNSSNNANNSNNEQDQKLRIENEKLQAEMNNLKMSQHTQQTLLNDFQHQNRNIQPKIYHTVSFIDHAAPTQAVKRSIISWAIQHNFRV